MMTGKSYPVQRHVPTTVNNGSAPPPPPRALDERHAWGWWCLLQNPKRKTIMWYVSWCVTGPGRKGGGRGEEPPSPRFIGPKLETWTLIVCLFELIRISSWCFMRFDLQIGVQGHKALYFSREDHKGLGITCSFTFNQIKGEGGGPGWEEQIDTYGVP